MLLLLLVKVEHFFTIFFTRSHFRKASNLGFLIFLKKSLQSFSPKSIREHDCKETFIHEKLCSKKIHNNSGKAFYLSVQYLANALQYFQYCSKITNIKNRESKTQVSIMSWAVTKIGMTCSTFTALISRALKYTHTKKHLEQNIFEKIKETMRICNREIFQIPNHGLTINQ